jgi:hypothetical protein
MFAPVMYLSPTTAPTTMDIGDLGLYEKLKLAVLAGRQHDQAGQINDGFRAATGSVITHWGLL